MEQHLALLDVLLRLPCMVMVSGYQSEYYLLALREWRLVTFNAATRGRPATEHLWMNYPEPTQLHDYRYLGSTYRERERIKRKKERWRKRIAAMDPLERRVLAEAVAEAALIADHNGGTSRLKHE